MGAHADDVADFDPEALDQGGVEDEAWEAVLHAQGVLEGHGGVKDNLADEGVVCIDRFHLRKARGRGAFRPCLQHGTKGEDF